MLKSARDKNMRKSLSENARNVKRREISFKSLMNIRLWSATFGNVRMSTDKLITARHHMADTRGTKKTPIKVCKKTSIITARHDV